MKITVITVLMACIASVSAQTGGRTSDRQVLEVLNRIDSGIAALRSQMGSLNSTPYSRREEAATITGLETALTRVRADVNNRRQTTTDLAAVLSQARAVDTTLTRGSYSAGVQGAWMQVRSELDTLAGYYGATANWERSGGGFGNTNAGYTVTPTEMRTLLYRLQSNNNLFRSSYNRWSRNSWRGVLTGNTAEVNNAVNAMNTAISQLTRTYNTSAGRSYDVSELLRNAYQIDRFLATNKANTDVTTRWAQVRSDLDTLSGYYRVRWNWDTGAVYENGTVGGGGNYGGGNGFGNFDARLTGTYRLNRTASDDPSTVINSAVTIGTYSANQIDRVRRNLQRRLEAPEMLAIEKRGQQITLASSNAPSVEMTADGTSHSETSPNGRTVTTSVTATNREVTINYEGDRTNDFYLTFTPAGRDQLRVTRRLYLENQNKTVTVTSVYDRTSETAQFNSVFNNQNVGGSTGSGWAIPNNTSIMATLDTPLSTRTMRDGDRFSMTVSSPSNYRGAVIEGRVVGDSSGRVTGRANMSLNFDTIRMRDGRTYQFAGIVDQVRQPNGEVVSVNNEGQVRDGSQTQQTVTRAGIGAALGAIIGAIAGGGSGAAIGAGVGAGAGAGSVILQGRDNLELATGSQFSITATAPPNVASRQ